MNGQWRRKSSRTRLESLPRNAKSPATQALPRAALEPSTLCMASRTRGDADCPDIPGMGGDGQGEGATQGGESAAVPAAGSRELGREVLLAQIATAIANRPHCRIGEPVEQAQQRRLAHSRGTDDPGRAISQLGPQALEDDE